MAASPRTRLTIAIAPLRSRRVRRLKFLAAVATGDLDPFTFNPRADRMLFMPLAPLAAAMPSGGLLLSQLAWWVTFAAGAGFLEMPRAMFFMRETFEILYNIVRALLVVNLVSVGNWPVMSDPDCAM